MNKISKIDKNAHYFLLMHPLEYFVIPGLNFVCWYKSSSTREKWVECEIVEENYKLVDEYKIELRSIEEGYGKETFYVDDFISHVNNGYIVKKTSPDMHCVEEHWIEPLTSNTYLHHSAYVLKKGKR